MIKRAKKFKFLCKLIGCEAHEGAERTINIKDNSLEFLTAIHYSFNLTLKNVGKLGSLYFVHSHQNLLCVFGK